MGVKTVKQVLTSQLSTAGTLVLTERLDAYRHADDGRHVLLLTNSAERYTAPDDFTVTVDGRGLATLSWLSGDNLAIGTEINLGLWQFDTTSNGTNSGGGGGGSDTTLLTAIRDNTGDTVSELETLNSSTDLPAPVTPTGRSYESCPVSATTELGATGAIGDDLDFVVIVPSNTTPGAVSIKDGAGSAITLFAGGTLASVIPFTVPIYSRSLAGAWSVTTGANVTAFGVGDFT